VDHPKDFLEQFVRHGNLGDLEHDVAAARADEAIESNCRESAAGTLETCRRLLACLLTGEDQK
jgi:hypothetical protein